MRSIGHLPTLSAATTFNDFLALEGIEGRVESNADGSCELWVVDEELIPRAIEHLTVFRSEPTDARFLGKGPSADALRARQKTENQVSSRRLRRGRDLVRNSAMFGVGPMSMLILAACALVFLLTDHGANRDAVRQFTISASWFRMDDWLPEVRAGEVWRLVTPILVHFGWIHLLCNSLMILSLGSLLEARLGSFYLLGFVMATAVVPNLAQFVIMRSEMFGGISGVAFALAGYAWMRGKHDPFSGIAMPSQNVTMLMIYFVWCWMEQFHLLGSESILGTGARVANVVHTAGLAMGCGWGWLDAWRSR